MGSSKTRGNALFMLVLAGMLALIVFIVPGAAYWQVLFYFTGPDGVLWALGRHDDLSSRIAVLEADNRQLAKALSSFDSEFRWGLEDSDVDKLFVAVGRGDLADAAERLREPLAAKLGAARGDPAARCEAAKAIRYVAAIDYLRDERDGLVGFEQAVGFDPSDPDGWLTLGRMRLRTGDLEGAEAALHRVSGLGLDVTGLIMAAAANDHLATVYERLSDPDRATQARAQAQSLRARFAFESSASGPYVTPETRAWLKSLESRMREFMPKVRLVGQRGYASAMLFMGTLPHRSADVAKACRSLRKARALFHELGEVGPESYAIAQISQHCCTR